MIFIVELEAENIKEFIELARENIEIRPKIVCLSDPNTLIKYFQFRIEYRSRVWKKTLRYIEITDEGVMMENNKIRHLDHPDRGEVKIEELVSNLEKQTYSRFNEIRNLVEKRDIKIVLYNLEYQNSFI